MENSFLYQIAKAYTAQTDVDLRKCLFVFPSRRSALFFQKYLGQCSDAPLFSPDIITIGDLFARLSPYRRGDKIQLMFILWERYKELRGAGVESFDNFVSLGETIMSDFNDVDKYMVDAGKLFANVKDLRELDTDYDFLPDEQKEALKRFWGVVVDGKNSGQKDKFLGLWEILLPLYEAFRSEVGGLGIAYEGMLQREVAQRISEGKADGINSELSAYDRIVVVGQNALCNCERKLYDHIKKEFDGDFYWDFYGECLTDTANKASYFIKDYIGLYPSRYELDAEADGRPEITVVAASSAVAQAKVTAAELAESNQESTAVVLPDENLLMPLLNSIPENIGKVNVTMGYGLHNSATASLMDMMAGLQLNARNAGFYHKDVMAILNHPFISNATPQAKEIRAQIIKANELYIPQERFAGDDILKVMFRPVTSTAGLYDWQMELLATIAPTLTNIEKEFAHGYYTAVSHLKDLDIDMEPRTYFRFLREITSRLTVDFRGEPLSGLQVMGPLEVRAIDFETLIVLSVNEGVYPAKQQNDSLIPYNVRVGFGLPTVELFDSIAAYHFYRSIYRAKKVVLIYDSRTKAALSGEESRFVKQLKYHYDYQMKFRSVELEIKPVVEKVRCVEKTPEIISLLKERYLEGGSQLRYFSASALNSYMVCPLMFYYKIVQGLEEEDEITEGVDAGQLGTAFHETMREIYDGMGTRPVVTKEMLEKVIADSDWIVDAVKRHLNLAIGRDALAPVSGRNMITVNMVAEMVVATLERDKECTPFTYYESEKKMLCSLDFDLDGKPEKVRFKGYIDRLDNIGGQMRICDYKTGSVAEVKEYDEKGLDNVFRGKAKTSFQLLLYAVMMREQNQDLNEFNLAVYDVKKLFFNHVNSKYCPPEAIDSFKERLGDIVGEIFNQAVPFTGIEADKACEFCPAKAICGR